jgi:RNA polymerase sigma factor (sigma-70 family)
MASDSKPLTDGEIIASLKQRKEEDGAIRALYRAYYEMLGHYVVQNGGSRDDAADTFQEAIIAFVQVVKAGRFRGESSIKTFLYALNRNIWLNELKKRNRAEKREVLYEKEKPVNDVSIDRVIEFRQAQKQLMQTLDLLGETCKKVLLLYYYENLSMREILANLDYDNEQVVRNKKYKCLKKLEELLAANSSLAAQLKSWIHE